MQKLWACILLFSSFTCTVFSQFSFDSVFTRHPLLKRLSANPAKYRLQVIYTQISEDEGKPVFRDFFYRVDPADYFYCASLVKLPVSILALQKLNEIGVPGDAIMFTDSSIACHRKVKRDETSPNKYPSVEQYIKKMLLVSENEAYSRVYEFLGVDYIHQSLRTAGFPGIRIINRYDGTCSGKDNLVTNPVTFVDSGMKVIYRQEAQTAADNYVSSKPLYVGKAHESSGKKRIRPSKDFGLSNYMSLSDCHAILKELIFDTENKFSISAGQRQFLLQQLSLFPRQSQSPKYDAKIYYDSYKKYLFYGDSKATVKDSSLIITNIVGQSYGFLSDCAHFYDKKNNIQFMLSAVIYANEDEIIDGNYDYRTLGFPYLAELGRQFYQYELNRRSTTR